MHEFASSDLVIAEAVRHYLAAIRQPELARAMHQRAADLAAASQALRALTQAAEEVDDRETDPWSMQRRFPELLAAHQATWGKALRSGLSGHFAEPIRALFGHIWRTIYLPILLDRSIKSAGIVECSDFNWVRIFGKPRQESKSWTIFCSDGYFANMQQIGHPASSQLMCPFWMVAGVLSGFFRYQRDKLFNEEERRILGRRYLYDYSPISEQDLSVSIEAMRDAAASIDYMTKLMVLSAGAYKEKDLLSLGYVYRLLDEKKISTAAFYRALIQEYKVPLHTLEVARLRERKARTGRPEGLSEKRSRSGVKKMSERGRKRTATRPSRSSTRREVTTP